MNRLLEITKAAEGNCDRCGVRVTMVDPELDRLVLVDAKVYEVEDGRFVVRCDGC